MKISDETLLQVLINHYEHTKSTPLARHFTNKSTYKRRFGNWSNALQAAGIPFPEKKPRQPRVIHPCESCDTPTKNPRFCCKSCSAKVTCSEIPRRKRKEKICADCNHPYTDGNRQRCQSCIDLRLANTQRYLGDIPENGYKANKYSIVRYKARNQYKDKLTHCQNCGYDKHVELCHIKPISSFSNDTLISDINHESNVMILCPNCHWELDHNIS